MRTLTIQIIAATCLLLTGCATTTGGNRTNQTDQAALSRVFNGDETPPNDSAPAPGGSFTSISPSLGKVSTQGFCWPVIGRISRGFNPAPGGHKGLDICIAEGTPVVAAASGRVLYSGNGLSGYGNVVIIDHGNGIATIYAHNSRNVVRTGRNVSRGQMISEVGQTGHATGPHCHFEIRDHGRPIDPLPFLP